MCPGTLMQIREVDDRVARREDEGAERDTRLLLYDQMSARDSSTDHA